MNLKFTGFGFRDPKAVNNPVNPDMKVVFYKYLDNTTLFPFRSLLPQHVVQRTGYIVEQLHLFNY